MWSTSYELGAYSSNRLNIYSEYYNSLQHCITIYAPLAEGPALPRHKERVHVSNTNE
jgi:hypothetical protein